MVRLLKNRRARYIAGIITILVIIFIPGFVYDLSPFPNFQNNFIEWFFGFMLCLAVFSCIVGIASIVIEVFESIDRLTPK
jgi:hypothetical protein